jgi:hypothetical protein
MFPLLLKAIRHPGMFLYPTIVSVLIVQQASGTAAAAVWMQTTKMKTLLKNATFPTALEAAPDLVAENPPTGGRTQIALPHTAVSTAECSSAITGTPTIGVKASSEITDAKTTATAIGARLATGTGIGKSKSWLG